MILLPATSHMMTIALTREFDNNALLQILLGPQNVNLNQVEQQLGVQVDAHGNAITISGPYSLVETAGLVLDILYNRLRQEDRKNGREPFPVGASDIDTVIRMVHYSVNTSRAELDSRQIIRTNKRYISPRSPIQAEYLQAIRDNELVFGLGPAGTGKTYLAVAMAVSRMLVGAVSKVILSRPTVEAGERIGFLPGDLREKVDPYFRPLYEALYDMLPGDQLMQRLGNGDIEVAPLAFMRGRTLANAFVILDEAQNTTPLQMKMLLTRLGENACIVVTGDLSQTDLPPGVQSGLHEAIQVLKGIDGIAFVRFTERDIVRHALVTRIIQAYQDKNKGIKSHSTRFE